MEVIRGARLLQQPFPLKQECGWKDGDRGRPGSNGLNPQEGKRKQKEKNTLDSYRPSHGRPVEISLVLRWSFKNTGLKCFLEEKLRNLIRIAIPAILLALVPRQIDSPTIHLRYGEPIVEVYAVRPDFEMTVRYGVNHRVCKLEVKSNRIDDYAASKMTNKTLDEIVDEVVPATVRGAATPASDVIIYTGIAGQSVTNYEQLSINRLLLTSHARSAMQTIVAFKDDRCPKFSHSKE